MFDLPPCAEAIADYYEVPYVIVGAVAKQEGGAPGVVSPPNRNGTVDIGLMQINSIWWDERNPVNLWELGITPERARDDACTSIVLGTWVLQQNHARFGNWFQAIAAYNAGPNNWQAGYSYAQSVVQHVQDAITRSFGPVSD